MYFLFWMQENVKKFRTAQKSGIGSLVAVSISSMRLFGLNAYYNNSYSLKILKKDKTNSLHLSLLEVRLSDRTIFIEQICRLTYFNKVTQCLVLTADSAKTRLSSLVLFVSAVWIKLATNEDCRRQKISKLFCSVSKCGEDYRKTVLTCRQFCSHNRQDKTKVLSCPCRWCELCITRITYSLRTHTVIVIQQGQRRHGLTIFPRHTTIQNAT